MEENNKKRTYLFEPDAFTPESYKEQAYLLIKDAILYRRFEEGIIYSQERICTELGISRTPVREALLELQKEGYIKFLRGRGMMLIPVSEEELCEVLEMRYYIETVGSWLAAIRIGNDKKSELWEIYHAQVAASLEKPIDRIKLYRLDRHLHRLIFEATNNRWLLSTVEKLRDRYMRVDSQATFNSQTNADAVAEEHKALIEAITCNEPEQAEAAMKRHINLSYTRNVPAYCTKKFESQSGSWSVKEHGIEVLTYAIK
jgi:DNA-binding GntR family transcriptional regulator